MKRYTILRCHVPAVVVVEISIKQDQRRPLFAAKVATGASKGIDDHDPPVALRHDREPCLNVASEDVVLASRMGLELPKLFRGLVMVLVSA